MPSCFERTRNAAYGLMMISIVIPTLNAQSRLGACLSALAQGAVAGLVKEALVVDAGSTDGTPLIADAAGARLIKSPAGRGIQLMTGAKAARGDWLLFLHADSVLDETWTEEVASVLCNPRQASVFRLRFDQRHWRARLVASGAMVRARAFSLPYGDQGLLISRTLYDEIGGYQPWALFEDVDLIERLVKQHGREALHFFSTEIETSADRYETNGYAAQVLRNFQLVLRYKMGASSDRLAKEYAK